MEHTKNIQPFILRVGLLLLVFLSIPKGTATYLFLPNVPKIELVENHKAVVTVANSEVITIISKPCFAIPFSFKYYLQQYNRKLKTQITQYATIEWAIPQPSILQNLPLKILSINDVDV